MLVGGQGKVEGAGKEVWSLHLDTMTWQQPSTAQQLWTTVQASCCPVGRTKVLCLTALLSLFWHSARQCLVLAYVLCLRQSLGFVPCCYIVNSTALLVSTRHNIRNVFASKRPGLLHGHGSQCRCWCKVGTGTMPSPLRSLS